MYIRIFVYVVFKHTVCTVCVHTYVHIRRTYIHLPGVCEPATCTMSYIHTYVPVVCVHVYTYIPIGWVLVATILAVCEVHTYVPVTYMYIWYIPVVCVVILCIHLNCV